MMRSEAIAIIKRGLGFRQTQDAAIIAALQDAQRDLELGHTLPTWLMVFDAPIAVTAGVANVGLPTGFIRFHDDHDPYYLVSGAQVTVPRRNYEEAIEAYPAPLGPDGLDGYPSVSVLLNKTTLMLVPTPTVGFTLYLSYYRGADVLTSEMENAWLKYAPNVLVGMAGMTVAGNLRDQGAYAEFRRRADQGGKSMMGDIVEDELAGRPLILGRNK